MPLATSAVVVATLALTAGCGSGGGSSSEDGKSGAAIGKGMAKLPVKPSPSPTPTPTPTPTDDPSDDPTGGTGLVTPDAKMGPCGWDSSSMPYADVKITNSSSTTQYYSIFVGFTDKDDKVVTSGIASDAAVPGNGKKTVKVKGFSADSTKKAKTCRITLATKSATKN
ncbi:hypothetical protein LRS74_07700 [Streptomyces sp. LX-29]|uniref:hypothetical protein n=1 Tax=Streptomyces sp. LX-29 TaxID=2900152 RepID=UPI00240DAA6F|nr:hypothetical protein [Streptomyces sp. LX-29]WFB06944.1 hypothetical protein LRS74_07700 [Streptomyces sp. LX-29]